MLGKHFGHLAVYESRYPTFELARHAMVGAPGIYFWRPVFAGTDRVLLPVPMDLSAHSFATIRGYRHFVSERTSQYCVLMECPGISLIRSKS